MLPPPFNTLDFSGGAFRRLENYKFSPWIDPVTIGLGCAATQTGPSGRSEPCTQPPIFQCSRCKLAKYCGSDHQKEHYTLHKADCCGPLASTAWTPRWWKDGKRTPKFLQPGFSDPYRSQHRWLWSREPAIDILNLQSDEARAQNERLAICFTSADDINDLLKTVNGIPDSYEGTVDILFNTQDPYSYTRFLIIFGILFHPETTPEQVAEAVTHILYSVRITDNMLERCIHLGREGFEAIGKSALATVPPGTIAPLVSAAYKGKRGDEPLLITADLDIMSLAISGIHRLTKQMPVDQAERNMRKTRMNPANQDVLDHSLAFLKPYHRTSLEEFRRTGMLKPHGAVLEGFTKTNLLMFTMDGLYMPPHHSTPLQNQDIDAVLRAGADHEVPQNDLIGALFFHIKDELVKFIDRITSGRVTITVCGVSDLGKLAVGVKQKKFKRFQSGCFDRIYFGAQMDDARVGTDVLLRYWRAQHLNAKNPNATMVALFRDYLRSYERLLPPCGPSRDFEVQQNRDAKKKAFERVHPDLRYDEWRENTNDPQTILVMDHMSMFTDFEPAMERYMASLKVDELARRGGLVRRQAHTVVPKRYGCSTLDSSNPLPSVDYTTFYSKGVLQRAEWTVRFVEFGLLR